MVALMEKHKVIFPFYVMKIIGDILRHKNGEIKIAFLFVKENCLCNND